MLRNFPHDTGPRYRPGRNVGRGPSTKPDDCPVEEPVVQSSEAEDLSPVWFGRTPRRARPDAPVPSPIPGVWPPLARGAMPPPVSIIELAGAYAPFQEYRPVWAPGELGAPGTIFSELARTPPLYRWQPYTDGSV